MIDVTVYKCKNEGWGGGGFIDLHVDLFHSIKNWHRELKAIK